MSRSKWSDEQREKALELCREHGPRHAARETGIPFGTISGWAKDAGVASDATRTQAATEVRQARWAERRAGLTDLLGQAAQELVEKARKSEDLRAAKDAMLAAAIAVDKAQLLSGGVTSRHEQLDAEKRRERVAGLVDELAARREQAASG